MHIFKKNSHSCFSSSRVKDTYLYHQAKPPPQLPSFKKDSFTISSHHSRHVAHRRRVMLGRGKEGGSASGSSTPPPSENVPWEEHQRQVLTRAMFSSLLNYINEQRSVAHHLTMEQLVSNLWRLPPAHRGHYTKLLMVLLIKKKVNQRRRAMAAAAAAVAAAEEGTTSDNTSPSAIGTCLVPPMRSPSMTCGSPDTCPCKTLPLNERTLQCLKISNHYSEVPSEISVPRLPFSENIQVIASEQVLPSARNRLSSGCDEDILDSSSNSTAFTSDGSSSGDKSLYGCSRLTSDQIESTAALQSASISPNTSFKSPKSPLPGRGQKRGSSPESGGSDLSHAGRIRRRVVSPHPSLDQSMLSSSQERVFSPEPVFSLSQHLREEPNRHSYNSELCHLKQTSHHLNISSLLSQRRTATSAKEMPFRARQPDRYPRSSTPRSSPLSCSTQHRRSWGNPLKRIFVQAPDTNGAAGGPTSSATDQTTPAGAPAPSSENGGSANNRVVPSGDSNSSAADSTSGGVSTSSNPFARVAPPSASWTAGSSSASSAATADTPHHHHHRPVLAPPKLGGFGGSLSSQQQAFPPRPASGSILAPSSLFGGATPKIVQPPDAHQSHTKFQLKPSILGSAVTTNPFSKAPTVDFDPDSKDNEAQSKKAAGAETLSSSSLSKSSSGATLNSCDRADSASIDAADSSTEAKPSVAGTNSGLKEGTKKSSDSPGGLSPSPETSSLFTTATPPPSPPPASMRRQDVVGGGSATAASSSSGVGRASVFGVFSQAVAAQEKSPAACSSPKPSALSSNGVKSPLPSGSSAAAPSFIFGQNLQSRVVGSASDEGENSEAAAAAAAPTPALDASEDNFFTAAASTLATSSASGSTRTQNGGPAKSLETSSRELAEKESREKRKFEEVQVVTGEETESNVLQMNCKVYRWVKGSWQERGRGILRLNDWGSGGTELHSRLVVRTQGTLTIMLNTNIWSEMAVERASNKSVRFTASDPDGTPNIYLVMGLPKDIELLYTSLEWRVSNSRRREQKESNKRARPDDQPSSSTSLN